MKRPHRRMHLLMWLLLAPATAIAGYLFWTMRPATPYADLPPAIDPAPETQGAP
jgi:hypothetical protein